MKRTTAKRAFKIFVIAGLIALMSSTAWGQQRRQHRNDDQGSWWQNFTNNSGSSSYGNHRVRIQRQRTRTAVSGVPEPSAALLFATGGLIVAHSVRNKRKKS